MLHEMTSAGNCSSDTAGEDGHLVGGGAEQLARRHGAVLQHRDGPQQLRGVVQAGHGVEVPRPDAARRKTCIAAPLTISYHRPKMLPTSTSSQLLGLSRRSIAPARLLVLASPYLHMAAHLCSSGRIGIDSVCRMAMQQLEPCHRHSLRLLLPAAPRTPAMQRRPF